MQLSPYLNFNGQCEEAFKFYEKCFGGKINMMMTYGDSPIAGEMPADAHKGIMHASMTVGDSVLMASDSMIGRYEKPQGLWVSIALKDAAGGKRIFDELAEGGTVQVPFEETFWAAGFGMVTDRFGTPWMINCERPA